MNKGLISPHTHQHLISVFLIVAILVGMKRYLIVVWFAFPWWLTVLSIFSCACWSFVYLLWRNVYFDPLPVFKIGLSLLLSYKCSLYILDTCSLSDTWFARIFSCSLLQDFTNLPPVVCACNPVSAVLPRKIKLNKILMMLFDLDSGSSLPRDRSKKYFTQHLNHSTHISLALSLVTV